jgi:hypothetical protein
MDWEPWPQQDGELVAENELAEVQNLADAAVANAVAAGLMQHPDQPQDSHSVSSETNAFFRAQGTPVTLELRLPDTSSSRALTVFQQNTMTFDSDYLVRELAKSLGLHQSFGPVPSVEMLLQDLALRAHGLHHRLALKTQLPWHSWNTGPISYVPDAWFLNVDHPRWGNNAEASTSSGYRRPILELISNETFNQEPQLSRQSSPVNFVQPNEDDIANSPSDPCGQEQLSINAASLQPDSSEGMNLDQSEDLFAPSPIAVITPPIAAKRKSRGKTPIVDDEVRRCSRFRKEAEALVQLDNEPRRKKGAPNKTVSFSTVDELKSAIVSRSLEEEMEDIVVESLQITTLVELGTSFCGVPPEELNEATLNQNNKD